MREEEEEENSTTARASESETDDTQLDTQNEITRKSWESSQPNLKKRESGIIRLRPPPMTTARHLRGQFPKLFEPRKAQTEQSQKVKAIIELSVNDFVGADYDDEKFNLLVEG